MCLSNRRGYSGPPSIYIYQHVPVTTLGTTLYAWTQEALVLEQGGEGVLVLFLVVVSLLHFVFVSCCMALRGGTGTWRTEDIV